MNLIIAAFLLSLSFPSHAEVYDYKVNRVVDGDTVEFEAAFLPAPLKPKLSVRIFGVDTPEKGHRAGCPSEAAKGEEASKFTKNFIEKSKVKKIEIKDWDKFGGRVLGDVIADDKSLRAELIKNGLAREYYGDKKKSWCE